MISLYSLEYLLEKLKNRSGALVFCAALTFLSVGWCNFFYRYLDHHLAYLAKKHRTFGTGKLKIKQLMQRMKIINLLPIVHKAIIRILKIDNGAYKIFHD